MKIIVENERGERLQMSGNRYFDLFDIVGTNPPVANINTSKIAGVDGSRFNSAQAEQRNLVLYLNLHPPIEATRMLLYKFFRIKQPVKIFCKTKERDVFIEGRVESFENNPFTQLQQPQISIICPQPYWSAVDDMVGNFWRSVPLFEFPFSIPAEGVEFSRLERLSTIAVNGGEIETGCIITFSAIGAVTNPKFYNDTTGEMFGVDIVLQDEDKLIICTLEGQKSVKLIRGTTTTNELANRASGSKWIRMAPYQNIIRYDAASGVDNLKCAVTFPLLYEGV